MDEHENIGVFAFPKQQNKSIIKVIGVGGGGGNAVNHMYNEGIHDVSFVVCNTDSKHLMDSPVPEKLLLGNGLGAGNKPEVARRITEESMDAIKAMLSDGTQMVFITAGMGGGTGTGAAPLIAKTAKEMGLLTVGIVTIPFLWEGAVKIDQALDGVEEMSKNVDSLLVINNERLREICHDQSVKAAFAKADDVLCDAARSIAEIITMHGIINLDFNDVCTVLKDGGVAIMSSGVAEGENRITKAIEQALTSPLLNNNDIYHAKKVLLRFSVPDDKTEESKPMGMDEMNQVHEFMNKITNAKLETKWGFSEDSTLVKDVRVTILATGFGVNSLNTKEMDERIKSRAEADQKLSDAEREKEAANEDRRMKTYGIGGSGGRIRKYIYSFKFSEQDIDNEDMISMVETSPTYKRTKDSLRQLTDFSSKRNVAPPAGTITF